MIYQTYPHSGKELLPVDIVLAPEWWNKNEGITFDPDFFFHPLKRVEEEQHMEKALYERWGRYGLGESRLETRPEIGAVHLASGFLLSEMLGCSVHYTDAHPPQVVSLHADTLDLDSNNAFDTEVFGRLTKLADALKSKHGYLTGDINWGGILNLALDVRGDDIFVDMLMAPDEVKTYFEKISQVIERFTKYVYELTGTSSISVNRDVRLLKQPVFLHSECSHTMISEEDYEQFLLPFDIEWSKRYVYGIHYCGPDPHRMASAFAKIPKLAYLDVGWGGDVKILREHLPDTLFSIRLSPIELAKQSPDEIRQHVTRLVRDSGNPNLTAICCINMDDKVEEKQITTVFETVEELRKEFRTI
jgi:hypothetical protein